MKKERWDTINEIVDVAMDLEKEDRDEFINNRCGKNEKLKKEVFDLLESMEESDRESFLESPKSMLGNLTEDISNGRNEPADSTLIGATIANYKIIKLIDHGGMGSVFKAERIDDAYEKKVALKLLRRGMDTPANIARFKRERNILANLDHPNITKLLDGGVTRDGLPFLVMDFVDGTPLYEYCDRQKLSIKDRLQVFKKVCKAVQHAHKNAVIHRDLKPSNILITDEGKVKVLDFGIAKLLESSECEWPNFQTVEDARLLTLRYAAPEMIANEPITTATDTYALGVLLYELLAGVHPFDFQDKEIRKIEKQILEEFPDKPLTRFRKLSENQQKKIAENRDTSPSELVKKIGSELGAIVLKAIRKEPDKRYSSPKELLDDLKRREQNQPISAKENTIWYRTSSFFRRRKNEIGIAVVFITMVAGFVLFHTNRITDERNLAQKEARKANEVSSFLLELFNAESESDTLTAAGLLQKGMTHLQKLDSQPAHADMLSVMGQAYINFGDYEKAEQILNESLNESKRIYGEQSLEYATAIFRMGLLYQKKYEWSEAISFFQESYELHMQLLDKEHFKTGTVLTHLGTSLRNTGEFEKAEYYTRKAVEIHEEVLEPTDLQMLTTRANLAYVLRERGKTDEAESIYQQVIEQSKDNPSVRDEVLGDYYNNLGYLYRNVEEYASAVENYRNALDHLERGYVRGHPEIIRTRKNLATSLFFQDSLDQTETLFKENLSDIREKYSENHRRTATSLNTLGLFYLETGDFGNAESYLRKSVDINRDVLGPNHLWTAYSEGLLTASLKFQNKSVPEIESLNTHHIDIYKERKNDLDSINKNQLKRLVRIYKKYDNNDSNYLAYQEFLD